MNIMRTLSLISATGQRAVVAGILVGLAWQAGTASAGAGERRELPVATITRADGTSMEIAALSQNRTWLLMVVDGEVSGGGRMLEAFQTWQLGSRVSQIVIVLQGSAADVARTAAAWQEKLPGVVVATDVKGTARRALGVKAIPTVLGARGTFVEWQVAGVLNDPEVLRQVILSWLADDRPPA